MSWTVSEQNSHPKKLASLGEDRHLVRDAVDLAAVVDGATDKSRRTYRGQTGGALAADTVINTLTYIDANESPHTIIDTVVQSLASMRQEMGIGDHDAVAPSASAAIALLDRNQIVRVGDVHIAYHSNKGWRTMLGSKRIDSLHAEIRSEVLKYHLDQGYSIEYLMRNDVGRDAIKSSLAAQGYYANREGSLGYGVLDGRPVPNAFIEVIDLPVDADTIVLATDGYLRPTPTCAQAEAELKSDLERDPLRIGRFKGTKAGTPETPYPDDRLFLSLAC